AVAVHVTETDVARVRYLDGPGERLERTDDAVPVEVRDRDVAGGVDLKRQVEPAFAALRLRLQGVETPVGGVADLDFVADVVLAGHLVNAAFGLRVRDQHPGLGEGGGRPKIEERAAAPIDNPEAGVLAVPTAIGVGGGGVGGVIGVLARAVGLGRAVAS